MKKHWSKNALVPSILSLLVIGAYGSPPKADELFTGRDNTGFSTGLHYALIHYITKTVHGCFSYILLSFFNDLAKYLAIFVETFFDALCSLLRDKIFFIFESLYLAFHCIISRSAISFDDCGFIERWN